MIVPYGCRGRENVAEALRENTIDVGAADANREFPSVVHANFKAMRCHQRHDRLSNRIVGLGPIAPIQNRLELVELRIETHSSLLLADAAEPFGRVEHEACVVAAHRHS